MTTTATRRAGVNAAPLRRRRRRVEWQLLRWQARLDARWADRVVPWAAAAGLFVIFAAVALARADRLDAGTTLARHVQAVWHLGAGSPPETTVGGGGNLLADRFPVLLVPLAAATRVLPVTGTLLVAQAAALAIGVVPLWGLARKVAHLRVGAASALVFAYAMHPAVADLALADFNPAAFALSALIAAAYFAEQQRWRQFGLACAAAALWSSELGIVVASMGVALMLERRRLHGRRALVLGVSWLALALFVFQARLGSTGIVGHDAFAAYGTNSLDIVIEMLRNPFRPVGDLLTEESVRVIVWILAPLLFLPVVALRKLAPALPLQAIYLVADLPVTGPSGGARTVPLLAFSFVAAVFALERLGRPSIERVIVDRRLLGLAAVAALVAVATASPLSPYQRPWRTDSPGEEERRIALALVPALVPVRVPAALAPRVAERERLYVLEDELAAGSEAPDAGAMADGVRALVVDESLFGGLDAVAAAELRRELEAEGLQQVRRAGELVVFLRLGV